MEIVDERLASKIGAGDLVGVGESFEIDYYIVVVDRLEQNFGLISPYGFFNWNGYKSFEELQEGTGCFLVAKNEDLKLSFNYTNLKSNIEYDIKITKYGEVIVPV